MVSSTSAARRAVEERLRTAFVWAAGRWARLRERNSCWRIIVSCQRPKGCVLVGGESGVCGRVWWRRRVVNQSSLKLPPPCFLARRLPSPFRRGKQRSLARYRLAPAAITTSNYSCAASPALLSSRYSFTALFIVVPLRYSREGTLFCDRRARTRAP